jgi:hypothetical protein
LAVTATRSSGDNFDKTSFSAIEKSGVFGVLTSISVSADAEYAAETNIKKQANLSICILDHNKRQTLANNSLLFAVEFGIAPSAGGTVATDRARSINVIGWSRSEALRAGSAIKLLLQRVFESTRADTRFEQGGQTPERIVPPHGTCDTESQTPPFSLRKAIIVPRESRKS